MLSCPLNISNYSLRTFLFINVVKNYVNAHARSFIHVRHTWSPSKKRAAELAGEYTETGRIIALQTRVANDECSTGTGGWLCLCWYSVWSCT